MTRIGRNSPPGFFLALGCCAVVAWGASPTAAQLLLRPVAIENARIVTMDDRVFDEGTLLIKGDRIVAVGTSVDIPLLAKRIDAGGATVTPGLIDAHSSLGRTTSGGGSASAKRRAEDAFDRYATRDLVEALSNGVTAVYLSPGNSPGVSGTGAVIRLLPDRTRESFGQVLKSQAALCIDLASASKPITRLKTLQGVEKAFRDALEYRESLAEYEEKLAEYAKQLKEQEDEKEADEAKQETKSKKSKPSAADDEKEDDASREEEDKGDGKEDEDKPKKPQRPSRNPTAEIVLLAIDRKIPVRVSAYRSADIFNALKAAKEFSLDMILEDVTEAHLVADAIADAEIHVVLGRMDYGATGRNALYRRAIPEPGAPLAAAGVSWIAGSGEDDGVRARFVAMNAQLAGGSPPSTDPLRIVTAAAAEALRVGDQIGRLRPGLLADFVLWSGDPLDPESRVRQVYVGGTLAFDGADESEEGAVE